MNDRTELVLRITTVLMLIAAAVIAGIWLLSGKRLDVGSW